MGHYVSHSRQPIRKRTVTEKISSKLRRTSGVAFGEEQVDFLGAKSTREWWRRSLKSCSSSSLCNALFLEDGKALADFFTFLLEGPNSGLLEAWQLSTSRFALEWTSEDFHMCAKLARSVEEAWENYLKAQEAHRSYEDAESWPSLARASTEPNLELCSRSVGSNTQVGRFPTGWSESSNAMEGCQTVDSHHDMYEFTVAAMFGIHVAMACFTVMDSALSTAVRKSGLELADTWNSTFTDIRLLRCLQNSCYRYSVPPEGTAYSPPTRKLTQGRLDGTFAIEDICPELFARLRQLCGVDNQSYYSSVCRPDVEFIELGTNSCSGEFFFFTHDGRFLLKTTTPREAETLMRMLPDLIRRFKEAPHSLLGKYVGLYRLFSEDMNYDRLFFVMMAATQHSEPITRTYDLKGSTKGRKAKPGEVVKKDLDFWDELGGLGLDDEVAQILRATHVEDVKLLRRNKIMDYSLLIQVHDRNLHMDDGTASKTAQTQVHRAGLERQGSAGKIDVHLLRLGAKSASPKSSWASVVASGASGNDLLDIDSIVLGKNRFGFGTSSSSSPTESRRGSGSNGGAGVFPRCGSSASSFHGDSIDVGEWAHVIPEWRPGEGISSSDGRYLYSMAIIDMVMPFDWWYPKLQVAGQQVISCGNGDAWSRQRPGKYADRQLAMMRRMCRLSTDSCSELEDSSTDEECVNADVEYSVDSEDDDSGARHGCSGLHCGSPSHAATAARPSASTSGSPEFEVMPDGPQDQDSDGGSSCHI